MELTKKGMEFWNTKESIGTIGTTDSAGNPFPGASTPTPLEDNSLVIRTNGDGKYILISPKEGKGWVILGNGTSILFGSLNLQEKLNAFGDAEFMKNVNIRGKLTINGQEVFPG